MGSVADMALFFCMSTQLFGLFFELLLLWKSWLWSKERQLLR